MSRIIENPKELIKEKAKEILYKDGYDKLSIRNIAKACGIATGTMYNYYPTKQVLVIEMMSNFWRDYLHTLEGLYLSRESFYEKLDIIFKNLRVFINTFREVWLKPELYSNPEYIESGLEKENIYIEKLFLIVQKIIETGIKNREIETTLFPYEAAKFITMNFITIIQMPVFDYSTFEKILKLVIKEIISE